MHILVQSLITLSSVLFWVFIDSIKIFSKPINNSALIHSVVSSVGHTAACIYQPLILIDYPVIYNNPNDIYLIVPLISFGYSFYDLYIGIISKRADNIIHGSIFSISYMIMFYGGLLPVSNLVLICETSSVFLNLRPYKSKINDLLFVSTFFIYRLIITPVLTLIYVLNPNNTFRTYYAFASFSITLLNAYWFSRIYLKYNNKSDKESSNKNTQHVQVLN